MKRQNELLVFITGILFVIVGLLIPTKILHLQSTAIEIIATIVLISFGLGMCLSTKTK